MLSREGGENASCKGDRMRDRSLLREGVEGILRGSDEEGEVKENLARFGERIFSVYGRNILVDTEGSRRERDSRFRGGNRRGRAEAIPEGNNRRSRDCSESLDSGVFGGVRDSRSVVVKDTCFRSLERV